MGAATTPPAWHVLDVSHVEQLLATGAHGLTDTEARERLAQYGPNQVAEIEPPGPLRVLWRQFQSPLVFILMVAAAVSLALGEYVDTAVIAAVLALNAAIGFVQERQAEAAVHGLLRLLAPAARVVRGGVEQVVPNRDLVPGDLVLLESGGRVPADLRLVEARTLTVDESLLTGESVPMAKGAAPLPSPDLPLADRSNMAYAGSIVGRGRGRGYVIATGEATEVGAIAETMRGAARPETPLQVRLARFTRVIGVAVVVCAVLAFVIGTLLGEPPSEMFLIAVALAVGAVPEGLPVAFTITLALGVRRMARRRAIVRSLPAVETLGSTTVIGSDKTGTLTENRMTVQRIWTEGRTLLLDDAEPRPAPADNSPLALTLLAGVATNEARLGDPAAADAPAQGDPTEIALLAAARRFGLDPEAARSNYPSLAEMPFEPETQYSASVRERDGRVLLFVKGAPERVAAMCGRVLLDAGPVAIDPAAVQRAAHAMAGDGLRVIAMAYRVLPGPPADDVPAPADLTFLGLQGLIDPPRRGVRDAIAGCRQAGVRVVMITGDHALTARAIGRELGIVTPDAPALTGADLDRISDGALREHVQETSIYARVTPEHKLRVVEALRAHGEVVAVTGDGVNDAPALRAADIGIAMGRGGTDVAREAADIVLADDNFVSIYAAVAEGRVTFDNLRKVVFFLISSNAAEVLTILTALALAWPLLLLPAQILWLNLVTDSLQVIALAFEPGEPGVLDRPPRRREEGILTPLLWERTALAGLVMAAGTLALFRWELDHTASLKEAQTIALTTLVLFQAFQAGNARSESAPLFRRDPQSNPYLLLAVGGTVLLHAVALYLPPIRYLLRVEPIGPGAWIRSLLVAATIVAAMEMHQALRRTARPAMR
jgi:Ca2+-transporting ATPase